MRILITGICGFVGSSIAKQLKILNPNYKILGIDNFCRNGSRLNIAVLENLDIKIYEGDIRFSEQVNKLPCCDWVIDAAANPSVIAGFNGNSSTKDVLDHNLGATFNILEYCKKNNSGLILLSTSRVYSITLLNKLKLAVENNAFCPTIDNNILGFTKSGITEDFSTQAPISLYGASKLASELLALEYHYAFNFPIYINRCGVLAGSGQFGKPDQGIFSFWINSYIRGKKLQYIGFNGTGHQVRDCLHPIDLTNLIIKQLQTTNHNHYSRIINVSGGIDSAISLYNLSQWCLLKFGEHKVESNPNSRLYDLPWVVLNSDKAYKEWKWKPLISSQAIFKDIAEHALANENWLKISND